MKVKVNILKLKKEKSESEKHLCLLPGSQLDLKLCLQARDARFQPGQIILIIDDLCIDHYRLHVIIIFIDSLLSTLSPRNLPLKLLLQLCVRPGENEVEAWFNKRWNFDQKRTR